MTDTGSMQPIPEAVAWSERADAWAERTEPDEPRGRWSDVAATGPADGVGWRTETAEWRATEQTARWRQTTEWRSASGTHGWRSTTEAWHTGSGAENFLPQIDPSSHPQPAISGAAHPGDDPVTTWQQTSEDGTVTTWRQVTDVAATGNRPSWQQTSPPWQQDPGAAAPPWEQNGRSAAPSRWQAPADPTPGLTAGAGAAGWSNPLDDGRHLVREDDRARWRRESAAGMAGPGEGTAPVGRRRAPETGSPRVSGSGTGWSTRSDADNWAGHSDTGGIPLYQDPAGTDSRSWERSGDSWQRSESAAPSWRTGRDAYPEPTSGSHAADWRDDTGSGESRRTGYPRSGDDRPAAGYGTSPSDHGTASGADPGGYGASGASSAGYGGTTPSGYGAATPGSVTGPGRSRPMDEVSGQRSGGYPGSDETGHRSRRDSGRDHRDPEPGGSGYRTAGTDDRDRRWAGSEDQGYRIGGLDDSYGGTRADSGARPDTGRSGARSWSHPGRGGQWTSDEPTGAVRDEGGRRRAPEPDDADWRTRSSGWRAEPDSGGWTRDAEPRTDDRSRSGSRSEAGEWQREQRPADPWATHNPTQRDDTTGRYGATQRDDPTGRYRDAGGREPGSAETSWSEPGTTTGGWRSRPDVEPRERPSNPNRRRDEGYDARRYPEDDRWSSPPGGRPGGPIAPESWQPGYEPGTNGASWSETGYGRPAIESGRRAPRELESGAPDRRESRDQPQDWRDQREDGRARPGDQPQDWRDQREGDRARAGDQREDWRERPTDQRDDWRERPSDQRDDWRERSGDQRGDRRPDPQATGAGDAVTQIRPGPASDSWRGPEPGARQGTGSYRQGSTGDWRRELAAEAGGLDEGESRRYGTQDFVPFRPSGSARVPLRNVPDGAPNGAAVNGTAVNGHAAAGGPDATAITGLPENGYAPVTGPTANGYSPTGPTANGYTPSGPTANGYNPTGTETDGHGPNGPTANVYNPNETAANGYAANGAAVNGTTLNGYAANGTPAGAQTANGYRTNGTAVNGSAVNGSAVNGTAVNGSAVNGHAERTNGAQVNGRAATIGRPAPDGSGERQQLLVGNTTGAGDSADTRWPPRQTGSYERRAVGNLAGAAAPGRSTNLLEPDDDEIEEDTGGPLAAVGYTVIWYGVPVVLFVLYMLVLNNSQQAHALSTLANAAPQFGLSLVLSMVVAVGLRWASGSWKAASVGLAAAVVGGGLATVLTSAITGNSLS